MGILSCHQSTSQLKGAADLKGGVLIGGYMAQIKVGASRCLCSWKVDKLAARHESTLCN